MPIRVPIRHIALLLVFVSLFVLADVPGVAPRVTHAAGVLPLVNLAPGTDLRIQQAVDVNVLLVGFGGRVSPSALLAELPITWNGVPQANGSGQTFIGQRFDFRYHVTAAPAWFEDALFGFLRQTAVPQAPIPIFLGRPPQPITPYQALYNICNLDPAVDPAHGCSFDPAVPRVNSRVITQNYLLDAAFVEKVLSQNLPPLLGMDVRKPTIVLMNWWGRPDYVDHIYLDGSEPDPETGTPRGFFVGNELAGYGGTSNTDPETCGQGDCVFHRLWFYDVSAGPMGRTGGFDLVSGVPRFIGGTLNGDAHYRFHHTADYGTLTGPYRPLDTLTFDIARLVDAVFLSGIAFAGPIYPAGLTPPRQPHHLVLDINRWNWSGQSFAPLLDAPRLIDKMNALPYDFGVRVTEQSDTVDSPLGRIWRCTLTGGLAQLGESCYGNRSGGYAFGDLQNYFSDHLFQFLDGAPDYEVPIFQFNVPPTLAQTAWAGYATSNYAALGWTSTLPPDMRQSFVFTSTTPARNASFGHGSLLEHEVGHHLGFSHPFQGYLCVTDTCGLGEFVPLGTHPLTWFSMSGQYVAGLMTYVAVNNDYSRFELDNLQRNLTWQYLDLANFVTARIVDSPRVGAVASDVMSADARAGLALAAYHHDDYAAAVEHARLAYERLVAAADAIHVKVAPEAYQAVRRNPADFNRTLRDLIATQIGDRHDAMSGAISGAGVRGLEGVTLIAPTTPVASTLPHARSVTLP